MEYKEFSFIKKKRIARKSFIDETFNLISSVKDKKQLCKAFAKIDNFKGRRILLDKIYNRNEEIKESELKYKIECYAPYLNSFKDKLQKKVETKRLLLENLGSFDYYRNSYVTDFSKKTKFMEKSRKKNFTSLSNSESNSKQLSPNVKSHSIFESPALQKIKTSVLLNFQASPNKRIEENENHRKSLSLSSRILRQSEQFNQMDSYGIEMKKSKIQNKFKSIQTDRHYKSFEKYLQNAFDRKAIPKLILDQKSSKPLSQFSKSESKIKEGFINQNNAYRRLASFTSQNPFLTSRKSKPNINERRKPILFSIPLTERRSSINNSNELGLDGDIEDESFASFSEVKLDSLYRQKIEVDKYIQMLENIKETWGISKKEKIGLLIAKRTLEIKRIEKLSILFIQGDQQNHKNKAKFNLLKYLIIFLLMFAFKKSKFKSNFDDETISLISKESDFFGESKGSISTKTKIFPILYAFFAALFILIVIHPIKQTQFLSMYSQV